ncbi:MAG TPA: DsbA family protein [Gammaproteobacteria bacterium]|nr:DsbA family protein [Gammaproteobacteria bacterium]
MRCLDVDAIIDDHRARALGATERTAIDAHLAQCARCAAAWLTNDALTGERIATARAGLFEATTRRVLAAGASSRPARPAPTWPIAVGLSAAGLAAALIVAAFFALAPPPATTRAPTASAAPEPQRVLVEGQDYRRLGERTRALPDLGPREVEVVQLFAYDCLPCYALERRRVERHALTRDRIVLLRIPVQWNEPLARYARAYYAAESLGKADQMNLALYKAIRSQGDAPVTTDVLAELFARFGVDRLGFDLAFGSQEVEGSAKRARELADAYRVTAVPTFVVDGELVTTSAMAKSYDDLLDVVEQLAECVERKQDGAAARLPC